MQGAGEQDGAPVENGYPPAANEFGNGEQQAVQLEEGPPAVARFYREDASFPYDLSTTSFEFFEDKNFRYINTERGCDTGYWWDYYTQVDGTWTEEESAEHHVILLDLTSVERSGGELEANPDPKTFWAAGGKVLKILTPGPLSQLSTIEWSHLKFFGVPPQQYS